MQNKIYYYLDQIISLMHYKKKKINLIELTITALLF